MSPTVKKRLLPAVVLALASLASAAHADDADQARRAFEDGTALEKRGDYAAALDRFKESATLRATPGNRFHVAYCLEMTGKLGAAVVEYEAVVALAREQKKAEILAAATARVEGLRPRLAKLTLHANLPPGGEVLVDGEPVDPAASLTMDPGSHVVTAVAPDHGNFKKNVELAAGATTTVDVVLSRYVLAAPTSPAAPPSPPPQHPGRGAAIATTIGAVVLVGGGVASFLVAGAAHDDGAAECARLAVPACDRKQGTVRTFDALALTGWIAGAALGALSVWLWTAKPARTSASRFVLEGRF